MRAALLALAAWALAWPAAAQDCVAQSCNRFMSVDDLAKLPGDVSAPFRDPARYKPGDGGGLVPREPNNCISFALDAWGQESLSGAARPSMIEDIQTRFRGDRCRQAFELLRHRTDVEVRYAQDLRCPAGAWLAVVMFKPNFGLFPDLSKGIHMVRQLSDGRFAQILGPSDPIAWVVRNGRIVDSPRDLLPFNTGFDEVCPPLCVARLPPAARDGDAGMPPAVRRPIKPGELAGAWTAVTPDAGAQPVPFSKGAICGPYQQKMELLVGVPPGWFGALIPGAPAGPRVAALEIVSNIIGDGTGFPYGGVNLTLVGRVSDGAGDTLAFDRFHDMSGRGGLGEPDRRTGGRIAPMIDPNGGVRLEILEVDRNVMRARLEAQTVCPRDLVFHRTRVLRGSPERVR